MPKITNKSGLATIALLTGAIVLAPTCLFAAPPASPPAELTRLQQEAANVIIVRDDWASPTSPERPTPTPSSA